MHVCLSGQNSSSQRMKAVIIVAACTLVAAALHPSGWAEITGGKTYVDGCVAAGGNTWNPDGLTSLGGPDDFYGVLGALGTSTCSITKIFTNFEPNAILTLEGVASALSKPTTPNALACCLLQGCLLPNGQLGAVLAQPPQSGFWGVTMTSSKLPIGSSQPLDFFVKVPSMGCEAHPLGMDTSCFDGGNGVHTFSVQGYMEYQFGQMVDYSGVVSFELEARVPASYGGGRLIGYGAVVVIISPSGVHTSVKLADVLLDSTQLANAQSGDPIYPIWKIGTILGSTFTPTNILSTGN
eukprot:m.286146 g.286146  ORF g.286146 m.286146 type:complete len:295 (-) comp54983_c1_seq1:231-1115(-)